MTLSARHKSAPRAGSWVRSASQSARYASFRQPYPSAKIERAIAAPVQPAVQHVRSLKNNGRQVRGVKVREIKTGSILACCVDPSDGGIHRTTIRLDAFVGAGIQRSE